MSPSPHHDVATSRPPSAAPTITALANAAVNAVTAVADAASQLALDPTGATAVLDALIARRDLAFQALGAAVTQHHLVNHGALPTPTLPPPRLAPPKTPTQRAIPSEPQIVQPRPATPRPAVARMAVAQPAPPPGPKPVPKGVPASPPASHAALAALSDSLNTPSWSHATAASRPNALALAAQWGPPTTPPATATHRAKLTEASRHLDSWLQLARSQQVALLTYAVAMARWAQHLDPNQDHHDDLFHRLTRWSSKHQPGYVNGLNRGHSPSAGSWGVDALSAWKGLGGATTPPTVPASEKTVAWLADRLSAGMSDKDLCAAVIAMAAAGSRSEAFHTLLAPEIARLKGDKRLRAVRKRIAKSGASRDVKAPAVVPEPLPADWSGAALTRGKRAVIVGGDKRGEARSRIEAAFSLKSVQWETGWEPRRQQALVNRIQQGTVDLVILICAFLKHSTSDAIVPACKASNVPFITVRRGYGVNEIRAAVERYA